MVEGLITVLVLSFIALIIALIAKAGWFVVIPQLLSALVVVYLLIRVRVKIAKAEKEKLKSKIDELEQKIESLAKKEN
jgi:membrane protein implicated in regulation of membrane protease activity